MSLPGALVESLEAHVAGNAASDPAGAGFLTGRSGLPLRRADLSGGWRAAVAAIGLSGLRIHDLGHHAATTFARKPDVTLKELMTTIGHASPAAASRYQHATAERGRELADYMDAVITSAGDPPKAAVVSIRP